jgi:hypothetical protein
MKLADKGRLRQVPVSAGFGFVTKRSASGRAKLEEEMRATTEGRSFSLNLHDGSGKKQNFLPFIQNADASALGFSIRGKINFVFFSVRAPTGNQRRIVPARPKQKFYSQATKATKDSCPVRVKSTWDRRRCSRQMFAEPPSGKTAPDRNLLTFVASAALL